MSRARPEPAPVPLEDLESVTEHEATLARWPVLRVRVPPAWKLWLEEAADARALSVAALVRQCIRALMVTRHENGS